MAQLITVDSKILKDILSTLSEVKKEVKKLHQKVDELEPIYGSDAWWNKETKEALKEVEEGKGKSYTNIDDLIRDLHA